MTHQPNNTMTMREAMARAIGIGIDIADPMVGEVVEERDLFAAADAVLAAMREPTEAMVEAGQNAMPAAAGYDLPGDCPRVWHAMLDAAKDGA